MDLIINAYFGWNPLAHAPGCATPVWDTADVLHTPAIRTVTGDPRPHTCTHPDCTHATKFTRVQLRLLCRTCGTVHTISAETLSHVLSHTSVTGWGQPPTHLAGMWLWPGRPPIPDHPPREYLITLDHRIPTPDSLHGIITGYRDADHVQRWIAAATPDETGAHQISTLRWRHRSAGLTTLSEAAEWFTHIQTRTQRPVVVNVG